MADPGFVPLSREEYKALEQRAARAEKMISMLLPKIDALEATTKVAGANVPAQKKQQSADDGLKEYIIEELRGTEVVNSHILASMKGLDPQIVVGAIKSLAAANQVEVQKHSQTMLALTDDGKAIVQKGASPEMELFNAIPDAGISKSELEGMFDKKFMKIAFGKLMKAKLAKFDKKSGLISRTADGAEDTVLGQLQNLDSLDKKAVQDLKRRKLAKVQTVNSMNVSKGERFGESLNELATVTFEDIQQYTDKHGNWTGPPIRQMNLEATALMPPVGCLHPLMKVRASFRQILLEMGFQEMRTNRYVESCFWNFDSLFQPQAHPARDAHDTFFLTSPSNAPVPKNKADYFERVRHTHQDGWETGSLGWRTKWSEQEASKNILRTHTTAISARTLEALAQLKPFRPGKYFSIDRVFRNEKLDFTHLAEFHQIEGFVIGKGLTLGHLIGTIAEFFKRIGIPDVKFKPAYNPYTEPSMEIFGWSEERQDFMEVGNSGVFRPEMLRPMGFDEDVSVIAWGLGLERQTMIKYKIGNIRDLFGASVDLNMCRQNPIPFHVI